MLTRSGLNRRQLGLGLMGASLAATGLVASCGRTLAQQSPADAWKVLASISADARALGLDVPVITASGSGSSSYREIFPALVDLIDKLDEASVRTKVSSIDIARLKKRANELLNAVHREERPPVKKSDAAERSSILAWSGLVTPAFAQDSRNETRFKKYHDGYLTLFDSCEVKAEHRSDVDWYLTN